MLPSPGQKWLRVSIPHRITCRDERADPPLCDCCAVTFERRFSVIVHPRTRVRETVCEAMGAAACVFDVAWG